jgi:nucleoside-diphosphate-sugar epimerase
VTVAVTGASGHLGRKVADLLLERLDPSQVILLTRTPDALASYSERVSSSVTRTSTSLQRSPRRSPARIARC